MNEQSNTTDRANLDRATKIIETQDIVPRSLTKEAFQRLRKNILAMIGFGVVVIYIVIALVAPLLPLYSFRYQVIEHRDLPPALGRIAGALWYEREYEFLTSLAAKEGRSSLNEEEQTRLASIEERIDTELATIDGEGVLVHHRKYILGTDYLGRDLLSRIVYGSQVSIAVGLIGAVTSMLIGIFFGSLAGYLGGLFDTLIMRIVDILYGLPYMLLVIIFMAAFGSSVFNLFFALAIMSWLTASRVVRGQVISLKNQEYVDAARCSGASAFTIITKHLIPNSLGIIIIFGTLRVPVFILLESFLSFLGLGISAPFASWGTLIADAVGAMNVAPWRLFFPSIAMSLFLLSINFLGDGLRDAFDPKSKYED